jgi:hypothetical protein
LRWVSTEFEVIEQVLSGELSSLRGEARKPKDCVAINNSDDAISCSSRRTVDRIVDRI